MAVWHIAAVRILYCRPPRIPLLLRRGRSHSLEGTGKERKSQMMRLTYSRLSIVNFVCRDRSIHSPMQSQIPPLSFSLRWSVSAVVAVAEPLAETERWVHFTMSFLLKTRRIEKIPQEVFGCGWGQLWHWCSSGRTHVRKTGRGSRIKMYKRFRISYSLAVPT